MRKSAALSVTTMLAALAVSRPEPTQSFNSFSFLSDYRPKGVAYNGDRRISPTRQELSALESLEDLDRLYAGLGFDISNKSALLQRLSFDWSLTLEDTLVSIATATERPPADPIYATIGDVKFGIHGIFHEDEFIDVYEKYFDKLQESPTIFLAENRLSPYAPTKKVIELADDAVIMRSPRDQPWEEFKYGLKPWTQKEGLKKVARTLYPGVPELEDSFDNVLYQRWHVDAKEWNDIGKSLPQELHSMGPFPVPIILDLKRRNNLPLNWREARSAYMAEVLRRWDVGNKRDFICGAAHSCEIVFFLKNPCTDREILDMAEAHANKINHAKNLNPLWPERMYGGWYLLGQVTSGVTVGLPIGVGLVLYRHSKSPKLLK